MKTKTTAEYKWIIQSPPEVIAQKEAQKKSFFLKLQRYIQRQERGEFHFKWLSISMITQAVMMTPLVGFVIIQTGNYLVFWLLATFTMYLTFVPSLSGLSTGAIIKTFFTTVILNVAIIITAIVVYLL
jgi:multisubunit Na+/H+ antiporter MnhC subunit